MRFAEEALWTDEERGALIGESVRSVELCEGISAEESPTTVSVTVVVISVSTVGTNCPNAGAGVPSDCFQGEQGLGCGIVNTPV
mmetsp:Transcript_121468/g.190564  ORF Transcript_121468/g.190564 Transcript_121468/m.190564 type:complete len:84 (-) Transcript_121468:1231-1482(-)